MKELSLNILDVAKNSVAAQASTIEISLLTDSEGKLTLTIKDDGCGMSEQTVRGVTDPFYTTRTTRKVGMGLPLLKLAAEQTGGYVSLESSQAPEDHGTTLVAVFDTTSIDFIFTIQEVRNLTIIIFDVYFIEFYICIFYA